MTTKDNSMVMLARNPDHYDDDDDEDVHVDVNVDGEEDFEDDYNDDFEDDMHKGRAVKGPRTKLASSDRMSKIERSITALAKGVHAIATAQKAMLEKHEDSFSDYEDDYDHDEDPMDIPEEEEGHGDEHRMDLGEDTERSAGAEPRSGIERKRSFIKSNRINRARVSKDDAASSFGEKDSDVPGNRPFDPTDTEEKNTVIHDGTDAGPGPVSKAEPIDYDRIQSMIERSISKARRTADAPRMASKSALAPGVGSRLDKSDDTVDVSKLGGQLKGRSFKEINELRSLMGDLPAGVI